MLFSRALAGLISVLVLNLWAYPLSAQEEHKGVPETSKRLELQVSGGVHKYLNEFSSGAPGSASLGAFLVGFHVSNRSMVGLRSSLSEYETIFVDGSSEAGTITSILFLYRHAFRVQKIFQPYLDAGVGVADPVLGFDEGKKVAFTFALGANWRFKNRWFISLVSRGVSLKSDDTMGTNIEGESITVSVNETTFGVGYLF